MLKRIFVNSIELKAGRPPCWVKFYLREDDREPVREELASEVEIKGASRMVYRPDHPIETNASLWIETWDQIILDPGDFEMRQIFD